MYRTQSEYDHALPTEPSIREQLEDHISSLIDAGDDDTIAAYVEHCETWIDRDIIGNALDAVIRATDERYDMAVTALECIDSGLANMLREFGKHVSEYREEFIEDEAQRILEREVEQ